MKEKELVKASKEGDEEAFSILVKNYQKKVFNMAYSLTRDPQVADDLAQEVFIKAYFALPRFKLRSEFGTWIYRIAVNHIKDYLRKKKKMREISLDDVEKKLISEDKELFLQERELIEKQKMKIVDKLIHELPEKHQIILTLRDIQGFSYEEISRILNISQGTVDSRLFRARRMLRYKLIPFLKKKGGNYEMQKS
ncbi:MAG: RNA polymerase sigma factor [Candidatus Aminicenantaceae bacterium]